MSLKYKTLRFLGRALHLIKVFMAYSSKRAMNAFWRRRLLRNRKLLAIKIHLTSVIKISSFYSTRKAPWKGKTNCSYFQSYNFASATSTTPNPENNRKQLLHRKKIDLINQKKKKNKGNSSSSFFKKLFGRTSGQDDTPSCKNIPSLCFLWHCIKKDSLKVQVAAVAAISTTTRGKRLKDCSKRNT